MGVASLRKVIGCICALCRSSHTFSSPPLSPFSPNKPFITPPPPLPFTISSHCVSHHPFSSHLIITSPYYHIPLLSFPLSNPRTHPLTHPLIHPLYTLTYPNIPPPHALTTHPLGSSSDRNSKAKRSGAFIGDDDDDDE